MSVSKIVSYVPKIQEISFTIMTLKKNRCILYFHNLLSGIRFCCDFTFLSFLELKRCLSLDKNTVFSLNPVSRARREEKNLCKML